MVDAVVIHLAECKAVEYAQREQHLEAFARRWRQVDEQVAITRGGGIAPSVRDGGGGGFEVGHRDRAAGRGKMIGHRLAECACVEVAGAVLGDGFERLGEIGLLQNPAEFDHPRDVGVVLGPGCVERWILGDIRRGRIGFEHVEFCDAVAVAGNGDGGLQAVAERQLAMPLVQFGPAGEITRCADGVRTALHFLTLRELLIRELFLDGRHEIQRAHALLCGDPAGGEPHAGKRRHERLDDIERRRDGDDGIEGIAAAGEHFRSRCRCERMGSGNDAVPGINRRARSVHDFPPDFLTIVGRFQTECGCKVAIHTFPCVSRLCP